MFGCVQFISDLIQQIKLQGFFSMFPLFLKISVVNRAYESVSVCRVVLKVSLVCHFMPQKEVFPRVENSGK